MYSYYCKGYGGLGELSRTKENPVVKIEDCEEYDYRFLTIVTYEKEISDKELRDFELRKKEN